MMAITDTGHDATKITRFYGLSTDTKPTNAMIGAAFYETDTKHLFVFDSEWRREKQTVVEQAEAVVVKEVLATDDLLSQILTELKINNAYLAVVTGDVFSEEDIDDSN